MTTKAKEQKTVEKLPLATSAAQILEADDLPEELVEVSEWGVSVKMKGLGLATYQRGQEASIVDGELDESKLATYMLKEGIVEPRFDDAQLTLLREKNLVAVGKLVRAITRLSGIGDEEIAVAAARFPLGADD